MSNEVDVSTLSEAEARDEVTRLRAEAKRLRDRRDKSQPRVLLTIRMPEAYKVGGDIEVWLRRMRMYVTQSGIEEPDQIALASKVTMAGLLLIYVALCVRSFIAARRARKV